MPTTSKSIPVTSSLSGGVRPTALLGLPTLAGLATLTLAWGQPAFGDERPAKAIQDNSFLVEEAYNQEAGVVQHIFTTQFGVDRLSGDDAHAWDMAFTQEWPVFSQKHQFSYTVPYSFLSGGGSSPVDGLGDMLLNYRYQALFESETLPAFAPRVSLILPTGDADKGLGDDTVGYQFNLPVSRIVSDRVTLHGNAGLTWMPGLGDRDPVSYFVGASVIYALTPNFNLMLESVGAWNETVVDHRIERDFAAVISPGFRWACEVGKAQLVLGIAAPLGLTAAAPDFGAFFYCSFEHRFFSE